VDLRTALTAVTGKIELVYEGEQEGAETVARHILGKAVREVFLRRFPPVHPKGRRRSRIEELAEEGAPRSARPAPASEHARIVQWFSAGATLTLGDGSSFEEHMEALRSVSGLEECARKHVEVGTGGELAMVMELILDGLHQCSLLAKDDGDTGVGYRDMIGAMFSQMEGIE